jgi:hypothetical protein
VTMFFWLWRLRRRQSYREIVVLNTPEVA